jgi:hypothetical protein
MSINIDQIYGCHNIIKYPKANKTKTVYETFLLSNNIHKIFNIKDTIHYKSLVSNNYNDYIEYIKYTNQKEHSLNIFLDLIKNFDINKINKIYIYYVFNTNKYVIADGLHRLSILLFKNIFKDEIPLKYLKISNNNCFYFVIYEHGINHKNDICKEIENANIRIDENYNVELPTSIFKEFIMDIYPDSNKKHIIDKNKYIIKNSKNKEKVKACIILVSISKWNVMDKKCKEIELVKRKIRNLYNPKFQDINKQQHPLEKGVSHNHVIHSIDHPDEFISIYNILHSYKKFIL